ncbi:MAG: alpha/beta hydrolase [Thermodesulfobacteriota bacterium]|nr:alpha/beta hydrolase [Thermodesulfobacteriota bacterium]
MEIKQGKLLSKDLSIFWEAWLPEESPKAVVHTIHGYGEHIDRYKNVVDELVPSGYALIGTDHRGHGRSGGRRCHVKSFMEFIEDERQLFTEVISSLLSDIPYFVLGHSMGSIIAMNYVERYPEGIKGLILSGTGSTPGSSVSKASLILAKIASRIAPGIHVKSPLPPDFISRDPDVVKAYVDDPLVYDIITPRLAEQMYTYLAKGFEDASRIKLPVLIQCGSSDTSFSGREDLYNRIDSKDKTIHIYEGLKHEVYNELFDDRAKVLGDLHTWVDKHV